MKRLTCIVITEPKKKALYKLYLEVIKFLKMYGGL